LRFCNLGKLRRRRKAFERGGEDVVGFERAAGRMIELRQRQRRAQLERWRALFAGDGDGRLQIAASAIRVGGRAEKPRLAADAEQLPVAECVQQFMLVKELLTAPMLGTS
jgi:hypothetical protein